MGRGVGSPMSVSDVMFYGFANCQLVLYISIVKIWNEKR